jgi:hypothetical protein
MSAPGYVPPLCPGPDPGADWQEMGWCCHTCAALAHLAWCPNHPGPGGGEPRNLLTTHPPASPVMICGCGYDDCAACAGYAWACTACGRAYFGTPPEHGLCPPCQPTTAPVPGEGVTS